MKEKTYIVIFLLITVILFFRTDSSTVAWSSIKLSGERNSTLENCVMIGGGIGDNGMLVINGGISTTTVVVNNCSFSYSTSGALYVNFLGNTILVQHSTFEHST